MPRRVPLSQLNFEKIAVICFGNDEILSHTLPVLRLLKKQYPKAKIIFAAREKYADSLLSVKEISKIYTLKHGFSALWTLHDELAEEFCDLVLDFQNDFSSSFLYSAFPGVPKRRFSRQIFTKLTNKLFGLHQKIHGVRQSFLMALPKYDKKAENADFTAEK